MLLWSALSDCLVGLYQTDAPPHSHGELYTVEMIPEASISSAKRKAIDECLDELIVVVVIVVAEKDGSSRLRVDYLWLSTFNLEEHLPVPRLRPRSPIVELATRQ